MSKKEKPKELSYFSLSLLEFLRASHPQLISEVHFILLRAQTALETYEQAVKNGFNPLEAEYFAGKILFEGLSFSKFDTLVNLIWNEFPQKISEEYAREFALKLLPECEPIFSKYPLDEDFACSPEFDALYGELFHFILENKIQVANR